MSLRTHGFSNLFHGTHLFQIVLILSIFFLNSSYLSQLVHSNILIFLYLVFISHFFFFFKVTY